MKKKDKENLRSKTKIELELILFEKQKELLKKEGENRKGGHNRRAYQREDKYRIKNLKKEIQVMKTIWSMKKKR